MAKAILVSLACFGILFAHPANAAAPLPVDLPTTSKWVLNYDTESCHLSRAFGKDDSQIVLKLLQFQPSPGFLMKLYGKPLRSGKPSMSFQINFGSDATTRDFSSINGKTGDVPMAFVGWMSLFDHPPGSPTDQLTAMAATPAQEAAVKDMTVTIDGRKASRLLLGAMDAPMEAMRGCLRDLVTHWGLDPAQQAALNRAASPIGSPGNWLSSDDYPRSMLARGGNGLVQFRLMIEPDGAISSCTIQSRINPEDFADISCRLIRQRAKFEPALDAAGKPVRSYFVSSVRWQMAGY